MQKGKVVVWEGFTNSWGIREVKSKGERERYTQLHAEFQRIAKSNMKTFFSEQCKEIRENNRMGKVEIFQENWRY